MFELNVFYVYSVPWNKGLFKPEIFLPEINILFLYEPQSRELKTSMNLPTDLKSITQALQNDRATLVETRGLFDKGTSSQQFQKYYFEPRVSNVENMCFGAAVIKIQTKRKWNLPRVERSTVRDVTLAGTLKLQQASENKEATLVTEKMLKKKGKRKIVTLSI